MTALTARDVMSALNLLGDHESYDGDVVMELDASTLQDDGSLLVEGQTEDGEHLSFTLHCTALHVDSA